MSVLPDEIRAQLLRKGILLEVATFAWNVIEGGIAITAGSLAGSVALVSFGVDSVVETVSAGVVGWRLRLELRGESSAKVEEVERRSSTIAGALLLGLAAYIVVDGGLQLLGKGQHAEASVVGIILTSLSLLVMPVLALSKLRTAALLGSGALRLDAYETITCAWLSFTTLLGLGLNALVGWWWADPLAAFFLLPLIIREGLSGIRGGHGDEHSGD
ncbi:MAG: cation transporter [Planctomycetota bacterium]|nr:cation transporter [Planctomycetota bacterium]